MNVDNHQQNDNNKNRLLIPLGLEKYQKRFLDQTKNTKIIASELKETIARKFLYQICSSLKLFDPIDSPPLIRFKMSPTFETLMFVSQRVKDQTDAILSNKDFDLFQNSRIEFEESHISFAIDNHGAVERDDAISLGRLPQKLIEKRASMGLATDPDDWLFVHISDTSRVVPPHSPIDHFARFRASASYFPSASFLMFPPAISSHLSIRGVRHQFLLSTSPSRWTTEMQSRYNYCITTATKINPNTGEIVDYEIFPSIVPGAVFLSYTETERFLNDPQGGKDVFGVLLKRIQVLTNSRLRYRLQNGARVDPYVPRVSFAPGQSGDDLLPVLSPDFEQAEKANSLVMEAMIATGYLAAKVARDHQLPFIYRAQLGTKDSPKTTLTRHASSSTERKNGILPVVLTPNPLPHQSLGLPVYSRFSSPIRRYGDFLCHHQICALLAGNEPPFTQAQIEGLIPHLNTCTEVLSPFPFPFPVCQNQREEN